MAPARWGVVFMIVQEAGRIPTLCETRPSRRRAAARPLAAVPTEGWDTIASGSPFVVPDRGRRRYLG